MKGWSISGSEHLGMSALYAEGAPCDGEIPVPAVVERQLDYIFEALLAKWESDSLGIHSFESAADHMWQTWAVLLAHAQVCHTSAFGMLILI